MRGADIRLDTFWEQAPDSRRMSRSRTVIARHSEWGRSPLILLIAVAIVCGLSSTPLASRPQPPPPAQSPAAPRVFVREQLAQTAAELKRDDQIMFIEELPDRRELVVLTNRDAR